LAGGQASVGPVYVRNETDLALLTQRLSFGITATTLGA